jgi:hypothetical protein
MKHWDERDVADVKPARLSREDRARLKELFEVPAHRQQRQSGLHSIIGLMLAVGVLVALAFALAPAEPISPRLIN